MTPPITSPPKSIAKNSTSDVSVAALWLKQGQLLAYPTESVWGIGCDAYNEAAVVKILAIKQRPVDKGMIVITDSLHRLNPLLVGLTTQQKQQLIDSWQADNFANDTNLTDSSNLTDSPNLTDNVSFKASQKQASTWVLPLSPQLSLPKWITGKHHSIAVRVIAHPLIQTLCQQMVSPNNPYGFIVSTSCNPSGMPPAKNIIDASHYFGDTIGYLQADTLGYTLPSQIRHVLTAEVIR